MHILPLRPLPSETTDNNSVHHRILTEGFVDEAMVSSVIEKGVYERNLGIPEGLALSSNADDYAGWILPAPSPFRGMSDARATLPVPARLPAPPVVYFSEPDIESPNTDEPRWWLYGLGGLACGIIAFTMLSLANPEGARGFENHHQLVPTKAEASEASVVEPAIPNALTTAR